MREPKTVIPRIKLIKRALKMPFHVFFREKDVWCFWLENEKGVHLNWTSSSIAGSVSEAMSYVRHEVEMGAIADPDARKTKEEEK